MAASFPGAIKTFTTKANKFGLTEDGTLRTAWASHVNDLQDEIVALETMLAGRPIYNIKGYGAIGNGVTDDTASIQAAITAAVAAGGGTVLFPFGIYPTNATPGGVFGTAWNFSSTGGDWYAALQLGAGNVRLLGAPGSVLRSANTTGAARCNSILGIKGSSGTHVTKVTVEGLTFDMNDSDSGNATAIYAQFVDDILVTHCNFVNFRVAGGLDTVVFERSNGGLIVNNHFREGAIAIGTYETVNTVIEGNTFYNCLNPIDCDKTVIAGTGFGTHGLVIANNTFDRATVAATGDGAIEVNGCDDLVITGNTIRNYVNGLILTGKVRNTVGYPIRNAVVEGNTIRETGEIGINLADTADNTYVNHQNVVIRGNSVYLAGTAGIMLRGTGIIVEGNTIVGAGEITAADGRGIYATDIGSGQTLKNFAITNNIIRLCKQEAISLLAASEGVLSGNCLVGNNVTAGNSQMYLESPVGIVVSANRSSGAATGFRTYGGSGEVLFVGNSSSDTDGFRWQGGAPQQFIGNRGTLYPGAASPAVGMSGVIAFGTAAGAGSQVWATGDIIINSAPAAGGFIGWVCTAGGTPGTWKTFGVVSL